MHCLNDVNHDIEELDNYTVIFNCTFICISKVYSLEYCIYRYYC